MEIAMSLLLMLGGVAVFMFGMKQMSQGMEQSAGSGVRRLFKKINKNRMVDYGVGIGATAIVQSSSATSIMTVGLANAGIVTVKQGSGLVLGAKVGTTLTAFIFALSGVSKGAFSVSVIFSALAFVGVIIIYTTNKDSLVKPATFLAGFGMLFVGLEVMEFSIGGKDSILSSELSKLFQYDFMQNPALLVLMGVLFTCIIQSSTAATGVFITFLSTGVIQSIDQSFFLVMGANIGTCSDGLMASIGTNANGKRIAVFHVLTSTMGATAFSAILVIFRNPITDVFNSVFSINPQWSLATFNLLYNTLYTLILLVLLNPIVKLVSNIIKEKKPHAVKMRFIDDRLLATPAIAIGSALKEVANMAAMAHENLSRAFDAILREDTGQNKKIDEAEDEIDSITRSLASYFIKISSTAISGKDEKLIGGLHHVINDIERIGDHAVLLEQETGFLIKWSARFLDETKTELKEIYAELTDLFNMSLDTFNTRKTDNLREIYENHQKITDMIDATRDIHIRRLNSGMYSVEVSKSIYSVLLSLQRVSDHILNIAFSIISDTGSETEVFEVLEKTKKTAGSSLNSIAQNKI